LGIKSLALNHIEKGSHMDNQEAKFILNAYRPGGQDASDPRFAEALAQARRDPVLERWFSESIAFDAAMTENLRAIEVPNDLRESILVGVKISRPLRWTSPIVRWAIAAAVLAAAIVGSLTLRETIRPRLSGWQAQSLRTITSLVDGRSNFDAQSHRASQLVNWLQTNQAPFASKLPKNLETLESLGCKTFLWNQELVSVICFTRPDGGLIHLVITKASAVSDRELKGEPQLVQHGEWATATWREGDKVYMLALEGPREQLRTYLL
jgi:hypothetical protein